MSPGTLVESGKATMGLPFLYVSLPSGNQTYKHGNGKSMKTHYIARS